MSVLIVIRRGGRSPPAEVFEHLPVKETIEIIPPEVKADPSLYERIGEETSFEVDVVPPALFKRLIVRPKYRHVLDRSRPPLVLARRSRPKSPLGQACTYLLNQWDPLVAHCDHGCTRIDNNLMENALRGSALGKKNFLFIGHPAAGERSAIIYSIIASCARHGIDALAYLRDVLSRLPAMTTSDDLDALTPARWQPATALPA